MKSVSELNDFIDLVISLTSHNVVPCGVEHWYSYPILNYGRGQRKTNKERTANAVKVKKI